MDLCRAKQILQDNFECKENCFIYFLYEKNLFVEGRFWEYYDSIAFLAKSDDEKTMDIAMQITESYQKILTLFICHFDPNDGYAMDNIPQNYNEYFERIEYVIWAYFKGNVKQIDDSMFELQR